MLDKFFQNKTILITGGTGSIGSELLKNLTGGHCKKIKIFSRDEYKQYKLRYTYSHIKNIEYILGDIRDYEALSSATHDVDILFHAAAYKHVPMSEEMPEEFIKTNILGSMNIKKAALANEIPLVVSISSDKAANPTNLMGLTKAVQEKIFASHFVQRASSDTKFISVRFGNVIGTAGSLFPILYHQLKNNLPVTITDPKMTRFFMSKDEAIDLIFWAAVNGSDGDLIIRKMKSTKISDLVDTFLNILKKKPTYPIRTIGIRVGEKIHEILLSEDEFYRVKQKSNYFIVTPYTESEIEKNVISINDKKSDIKIFNANTPENFLTHGELTTYINDFIKAANINNQFI